MIRVVLRKWLLVASLVLAATGGQISAARAEIAHWSFDEIRSANTIPDQAARGDAKISGEISADILQPGLLGQAMLFDMTRNHLEVAGRVAPSLIDDFTIYCVVYPHSVESYRTIFWKGNRKVDPEAVNFHVGIRDGRIQFKSKDGRGRWMVHSTDQILVPDAWYAIAIYFKRGSVEISLNGINQVVHEFFDRGGNPNLVANDFPLIIGQFADAKGPAYPFSGLLDEIKILKGRHLGDTLKDQEEWRSRIKEYEAKLLEASKRQADEQLRRQQEWAAAYADVFNSEAANLEAPFFAVTLPSTQRFNKNNEFIRKVSGLEKSIKLSSAGNEYEGAQILVVAPPDRDAENIQVFCSDLKNASGSIIASSCVEWGWIKSIETVTPDIPVEFVGEIPDAIIEGDESFDVKALDFTPVFVRFYVPDGTPPGLYRGSVTLSHEGFSEELPVEIEVYAFDLPAKNSIRVSFSFFEPLYSEWFNRLQMTDERKEDIYSYLLKYRLPPSNIYTKLPVYPELKFLELFKDRMDFFTIQHWGNVVDEQQVEAKIAAYRQTLSEIKKIGLEDSVYFYGVDELSDHLRRGIPQARQAHEALSKAFPGLRTMQTSFPIPEIREFYNTWIPLMNFFVDSRELQTLEKIKQEGNELWWYAADHPLHPLPNFYLDYPVFDSRIIMTLSYQYKVDGILYWSINREWKTNLDVRNQWPDSGWKPYIYRSAGQRKLRNGMGNLIYPGRAGEIYSSLRLENLRDGIEDYEYLALLERKIEATERQGGANAEMLREAKALLNVPADVAKAVNDYNSNPEPLMRYRAAVAHMIERLKGEES